MQKTNTGIPVALKGFVGLVGLFLILGLLVSLGGVGMEERSEQTPVAASHTFCTDTQCEGVSQKVFELRTNATIRSENAELRRLINALSE